MLRWWPLIGRATCLTDVSGVGGHVRRRGEEEARVWTAILDGEDLFIGRGARRRLLRCGFRTHDHDPTMESMEGV